MDWKWCPFWFLLKKNEGAFWMKKVKLKKYGLTQRSQILLYLFYPR